MVAVGPSQPVSVPPVVGECVTTLKPPQPGAAVQQSLSRMWRSGDGKLRCDSPESSVIIDLASQQTIVLDHLKKEASVFRMPQLPGGQFGGLGGLPDGGLMKARLVNVEDLGKSMIEGHEVFGKRFTFQPPGAPTMPRMPQAPVLPNMPQAPALPKTQYTVAEIWTSTKLQLPVYSKTTGSFGEQIRRCRYAEAGEPNPSVFQIPAGYKPPVPPTPPTPPTLPTTPAVPTAPTLPNAPAVPQAPTLPTTPKIPGISR